MKKKTPSAVEMAQAFKAAKEAELAAAREVVKTLEMALGAAIRDVREAKEREDEPLPQCRMVYLKWHDGAERSTTRVVIIRRTPGGLLMVRYFGDHNGSEYKFKFSKNRGVYMQAEKNGFTTDRRELRDVPAEYMPTGVQP